MAGQVFLLGAGFSKAVDDRMPLMGELGVDVAARFLNDERLCRLLTPSERRAMEGDEGAAAIPLGDVEVWLSSLTVDQPFLTVSENLERRALASELASVIAKAIELRQATVTSGAMPPWVMRLVALWHLTRSHVLTLNYDTLVESAVNTMRLLSDGSSERALPGHVLDDVPRPPPEDGSYGAWTASTMTLYKLHGSTNWFGRPEATDIFSVIRDDRLVGVWRPPTGEAPHRRRRIAAGLEPMIMPPTAEKARLYTNATMAGIWQRARRALENAEELVVFGYSLPVTDASMRAFLSRCLSKDARITVIDPVGDRVVKAFNSLGFGSGEWLEREDEAYEALLDRLEGAVDLLAALQEARNSYPSEGLAVRASCDAFAEDVYWPVHSAAVSSEGVELVVAAEAVTAADLAKREQNEPTAVPDSVAGGVRVQFPTTAAWGLALPCLSG